MTAPITSSVFQMDLASPFRERWGGRTVNDGDVRDIRGFRIDVAGQPTRGQESYRSTVTGGSRTTLYDPARPPHTPPQLDASLPSSSLLVLQDKSHEQFKAALEADASNAASSDHNPYAFSMPEWVEIQRHEETHPEQITAVGYFVGGIDLASQKAFASAQVDRLKALAKIERDLGAEYGEPVKLAWDGTSGEYMMLRPGQAGYDNVRSVNDLVSRLPKDLGTLGLFSPDEIDRMTA